MPHSNCGGIVGRFSSSSSVGGNDDDDNDDDGGGEEVQWEMEMSPLDMLVTTKGAWGGLWKDSSHNNEKGRYNEMTRKHSHTHRH